MALIRHGNKVLTTGHASSPCLMILHLRQSLSGNSLETTLLPAYSPRWRFHRPVHSGRVLRPPIDTSISESLRTYRVLGSVLVVVIVLERGLPSSCSLMLLAGVASGRGKRPSDDASNKELDVSHGGTVKRRFWWGGREAPALLGLLPPPSRALPTYQYWYQQRTGNMLRQKQPYPGLLMQCCMSIHRCA